MSMTHRFPSTDPDLMYDLAKERLATQITQVDSLDAKIGNLLGFGSALLAIIVALLGFRQQTIPVYGVILLSFGAIWYLAMAVILLVAYYTKRWESGPNLDEAWQYSSQYPSKTMYWWAAESLKDCYSRNKNKIAYKTRAIKAGMPLLIAETLTLAAGLISGTPWV